MISKRMLLHERVKTVANTRNEFRLTLPKPTFNRTQGTAKASNERTKTIQSEYTI